MNKAEGLKDYPDNHGKYRFVVRRIYEFPETHERKQLTALDFSISGPVLFRLIDTIPKDSRTGLDYFRFYRGKGKVPLSHAWVLGFLIPVSLETRKELANLLIDPRDWDFSARLKENVPADRRERWALAADVAESRGHLRFAEMLRNWLEIGDWQE